SRMVSDPANTMGAPVLDHSGTAAYTGSRWGDFSGTTIDPSDNTTFWTMQEYATSTSPRWSNWVTSFNVGACTAPSITADPSPRTRLSAAAAPSRSPSPLRGPPPTAGRSRTPR